MSLILENGTGVANAVSYISATDATTYLTAYEPVGITAWPGVTADQEAALVVGCQALELNYRELWLSQKRSVSNDLSWPRYYFYDKNGLLVSDTTIPNAIKQAQATLALYHVQGVDVFPQPSRDTFITGTSVKVGDLSESITYGPGAAVAAPQDVFHKVSLLLWHLTRGNTATALVR